MAWHLPFDTICTNANGCTDQWVTRKAILCRICTLLFKMPTKSSYELNTQRAKNIISRWSRWVVGGCIGKKGFLITLNSGKTLWCVVFKKDLDNDLRKDSHINFYANSIQNYVLMLVYAWKTFFFEWWKPIKKIVKR